MKDAFNREIKVGDALVYGTRQGSGHDLNIAIVDEIAESKQKSWDGHVNHFLRVTVYAGTGTEFSMGVFSWNKETEEGKYVPLKTRKATLTMSKNTIILDGVDVQKLNDIMFEQQNAHLAAKVKK